MNLSRHLLIGISYYRLSLFLKTLFVLLAMLTMNSITGTSVSTPTLVASATGEVVPNNAIATATASSKEFEAPIIPAGDAISCGSLNILHARYAIANTKNVCKTSGTAKGTNECHNKMLRRFIPKGKSIDDYSADDILYFADKINNLPRKILGYRTPEELFEQELDRIYVAA